MILNLTIIASTGSQFPGGGIVRPVPVRRSNSLPRLAIVEIAIGY